MTSVDHGPLRVEISASGLTCTIRHSNGTPQPWTRDGLRNLRADEAKWELIGGDARAVITKALEVMEKADA